MAGTRVASGHALQGVLRGFAARLGVGAEKSREVSGGAGSAKKRKTWWEVGIFGIIMSNKNRDIWKLVTMISIVSLIN